MKIEEAKKKWCPFARVGTCMTDEYGWSYNRTYLRLLPDSSMCIADRCMLWKCYDKSVEGFCGMGKS